MPITMSKSRQNHLFWGRSTTYCYIWRVVVDVPQKRGFCRLLDIVIGILFFLSQVGPKKLFKNICLNSQSANFQLPTPIYVTMHICE